jgi:hypothetical protein
LPAVRSAGPLVIDGRLDEPDWARAPVASDFVQSEPLDGQPATESTQVRVLYDDDALYVGVFAKHQRVADIVVNELKKDFDGASTDWVAVIVDTFHDRRNGYQFGVNPRGAAWDSQKFNEGRERNLSWDGAWTVRTTTGDSGWYAEFAIPFRTLQIPKASPQTWGVNFQRHLQRRLEESFWSPIPRQYALDRLSLAGDLHGLEDIDPGVNLRVKPYVLARTTPGGTSSPGRPFEAGVDVKYGITSSVVADLSINTDFSQVEADVQQVGATRFSVLFPEKREFFLENSGIFQFGPGGARSSRISFAPGTSAGGRDNTVQNDLALFFSRRIGLSEAGEALPILVGARVTGHMGRTSLGALHVRQRASDEDPSSVFNVVRLRRNLWTTSDVGVMLLDRRNGNASGSRVGGVDVNLRPIADVLVYGYAAKALDEDASSSGGRSVAARAGVTWQDRSWVADGSYGTIGSQFEDGLGFVPRRGIERGQALLGRHFRPRAMSRWLRDIYPVAGVTDVRREHGGFDSRYAEYRLLLTLQDGATLEIGANPNEEDLTTPFVVNASRGIDVRPGRYAFTDRFAAISTSKAKPYALDARISSGGYYDGRRQLWQVGATARVNVHLNGSLSLTRDRVDLPAGSATTYLIAARVNGGFSTRAFLNGLVQYNSSTRRWDTNVRFNLIHHPLSDLFVVIGEQREGLTAATPRRTVTLKFTQLFSF